MITAWRVRAGSVTSTTSLKVSRPLGFGLATGAGGGGTMTSYQPILADGGPARPPNITAAREIALNAVIEPTSEVGGPSPLSVLIEPTKAVKRALVDGRRPKAKLKLIFTPTGGSASTQVVKVKLKP